MAVVILLTGERQDIAPGDRLPLLPDDAEVRGELPFLCSVVLLDDASRVLVQRENIDLPLLDIRERRVILNVGMKVGDKLSDETQREDFRVFVLPEPE